MFGLQKLEIIWIGKEVGKPSEKVNTTVYDLTENSAMPIHSDPDQVVRIVVQVSGGLSGSGLWSR